MHIAQIAPPWYPVPPAGYGGIERVVHDLTEGLVAAGHEVTLCAPAGSTTTARLIPTAEKGVGLDLPEEDKERWFVETTRHAYEAVLALGADIVHDHTDHRPGDDYPLPIVHTIHGPAIEAFVRRYQALSAQGDQFIAISGRQRQRFEEMTRERCRDGGPISFAGMVHNPVHVAATPFYGRERKDGYVAFLGRCHWEKGPDIAIRVAQAAGVPLKMGLRITTGERTWYQQVVAPLLARSNGLVECLGEIGGAAKDELLGRASAVIFSSPWEEPFGLVLTEAAAHGTPVVAFRRGSAPEIVIDGVTGFLCDDEADMVHLLHRAMELDPAACRAHAEKNWARPLIAARYIELYERVLSDAAPRRVARDTQRRDLLRLLSAPADQGAAAASSMSVPAG